MTDQPEKLDLTSHNLPADKTAELLRLFPEIRTEGDKIDFDKLKLVLGQTVDVGKERYGMTWPGKADCFKTIQAPSTGTLLPAPEESVDFDTTENLIIEGDNLNVLKLLQKAYLGKVKMIYIDPPYNTGNDFIYPDNYAESLQTYLEYTGQVDAEGRKFGTNTDVEGRFHSRWLSMMYPRLYLARNLLSEEGMVFISIDDNEVDNLLKLCDEIFGEENFVGVFVINSSPSAIDYGHIAKQHDYVVFYAKNLLEANTNQLIEKEKEFKYTDKIGPFNIYPLYNGNVAFNPSNRPNLYYPFYLNPNNEIEEGFYEISLEKQDGWIEVFPVVSKKDGIQRIWRWGREKSKNNLNKEIIGYKTEDGEYRVVQKSRHTGKVIRSIQSDQDISSRRGTAEVEAIFGSKAFSFPKPIELVKKFISISMEDGDIALDFFAGSGTTAHAILDLNKQDDLNFKFILVQLPEATENKDFPTISDITKERVRRVIKKLNDEEAGQLPMGGKQDRGFRVFKLAESNFKGWEASAPKDGVTLAQQLELHIDHIREGRTSEDILYEILLKSGFPLTTPVEKVELDGKPVYSVAGGGMLICLEKELTLEVIRAMAEKKPQRVICLDLGFVGNDQLKANAVQIFKTKEVVFKTV
ncbi:MAG TPA: site-specific DNA-methyltransferase [Anaerolineales bacterium]|nr:site-specific DNA-methyltransferase [Anaerolineales bacterium]